MFSETRMYEATKYTTNTNLITNTICNLIYIFHNLEFNRIASFGIQMT